MLNNALSSKEEVKIQRKSNCLMIKKLSEIYTVTMGYSLKAPLYEAKIFNNTGVYSKPPS